MEITTYPLNNIEYSAEDAELFHVTRTSGIYAKNSFDYSVTGADNTIIIGTGIGWIKNSEFAGKVIALKDRASLDMGLPDSVHPRIDAIVIQFDANMNATNIVVKKGTASSEPIPPEVSRNEAVYELHLYHVRREAGSLSITPSNITDLRLNSSYCGLMADSVTSIDTYAIEKQVADLIKSLQNEISNVKDGSAYLLRDGSTRMTGNLQMDGNTITGLGTPVNDNDAVPWEKVKGQFAPAGYGLGGSTMGNDIWGVADLDNHAANGWYYLSCMGESIDGYRFNGAIVRISNATLAGPVMQEVFPLNTNYCVRRIRNTDGVWQPWEWENPPMVPGVLYRTAKYCDNKPVYKLRLDCGALPNAATAYTSLGMSVSVYGADVKLVGADLVVKHPDTPKTQQFANPSVVGGVALAHKLYSNGALYHFGITTDGDLSAYTAVVTLELILGG